MAWRRATIRCLSNVATISTEPTTSSICGRNLDRIPVMSSRCRSKIGNSSSFSSSSSSAAYSQNVVTSSATSSELSKNGVFVMNSAPVSSPQDSAAAVAAENAIQNGPRNDWTREDIQAIYDSPLMDLLLYGVGSWIECCLHISGCRHLLQFVSRKGRETSFHFKKKGLGYKLELAFSLIIFHQCRYNDLCIIVLIISSGLLTEIWSRIVWNKDYTVCGIKLALTM